MSWKRFWIKTISSLNYCSWKSRWVWDSFFTPSSLHPKRNCKLDRNLTETCYGEAICQWLVVRWQYGHLPSRSPQNSVFWPRFIVSTPPSPEDVRPFGSAKARVGLRRLPSGPLGAEQLSGGMEKMLLMMMMMTTIWLFGSSSVCPRLFLHCLPLLGLRTFHRGIFRSGTLGKSTDHRAQSPRCGDALACHSYHMGWPREFIGAGTLWFLVAVRISTVVAGEGLRNLELKHFGSLFSWDSRVLGRASRMVRDHLWQRVPSITSQIPPLLMRWAFCRVGWHSFVTGSSSWNLEGSCNSRRGPQKTANFDGPAGVKQPVWGVAWFWTVLTHKVQKWYFYFLVAPWRWQLHSWGWTHRFAGFFFGWILTLES